MKTKAIPTKYKDVMFRSRLEAKYAVFFDELQIHWEYEPEGTVLHSGECYLPDFGIHDIYGEDIVYIEVKAEGYDIAKMENKLVEFSKLNRLFLAIGQPGPKPFLQVVSDPIDEEFYCHFTTDCGSTEVKGGIRDGQYRIWTASDDYVSEYEIAAEKAKNYRFGKLA